MKRTTLFIDEAVDHELHAVARRKGVPVSSLVRESLSHYLEDEKRGHKLSLRFLGRGRSGKKDIAERHEELLWRGLAPHGGEVRRGRRRQG
jgi:hypothetical protein